jgi:phage minor structural protein
MVDIMIPVLYDKSTTDVSNLGIGSLGETISCTVSEKIDEYFTLDLIYPLTGMYANDLELDNIIAASVKGYSLRQLFRIVRIEKNQQDIQVHAVHVSYQLNSIPVNKFTANSAAAAMSGLKNNSADTNPFDFNSNITSSTPFSMEEPGMIRELLLGSGGIAETYGGEVLFNNYHVTLVSRRGSTADSDFMYGKNIVTIVRSISAEDLVTAIYPFYKKDDTLVVLPEGIISTSTASNYAYKRVAIVDLSSEFDSETTPTVSELRTKAQEYLNNSGVGLHTDSIEVVPVILSDYEDNEIPESILIGDTVNVSYEPLGISYSARITAYEWDVLMMRYIAVTVGKPGESLAEYINHSTGSSAAAGGGGGGGTIIIDSSMSDTSQNAVMNKTIKLYVDGLAGTKVDKVTGKGLSTNDFTNALLTKLNGIESGAEVNVQSNWAETDSTSDAYIQNKPAIPTVNNGTLTINVNGTGVGSFSANQSTNTTANITVPTKTSELTNDSGYVSGVDHASATNWGTVTFTSNEPGVGYATIGYSSNGSNTTSKLAKVDSSTNTISSEVLPSPTSTTKGGVTISDESDGSLAIGGHKVAPLVAPSNKISPSFLPDVDKWNGVALEKTATGAGGKYVPVLSSTSATTANLSKVTTSPNDVGHIPVYDGDGWLYANTIDSSADGKAVANKTYVDTKVSSISIPTKTSDLTNDSGFITDVTVAGSSVVSNNVAAIPKAGRTTYGTVEVVPEYIVLLTARYIDLVFDIGQVRLPMMNTTTNKVVTSLLPDATTTEKGIVQLDDTMSDTSTNPVQNKTVKAYIDQITPSGVITDVQVNGSSVVTDHVANITVPTQTSQLTNNSGFITNTDFATNVTGGVVKVVNHESDGYLELVYSGNTKKIPWVYINDQDVVTRPINEEFLPLEAITNSEIDTICV